MINKKILEDPEVEFDFENDYEDTIKWLEGVGSGKAEQTAFILVTRALDEVWK